MLFLNFRNLTVLCTLLNSSQENIQRPGEMILSFQTMMNMFCSFQEYSSFDK